MYTKDRQNGILHTKSLTIRTSTLLSTKDILSPFFHHKSVRRTTKCKHSFSELINGYNKKIFTCIKIMFKILIMTQFTSI